MENYGTAKKLIIELNIMINPKNDKINIIICVQNDNQKTMKCRSCSQNDSRVRVTVRMFDDCL